MWKHKEDYNTEAKISVHDCKLIPGHYFLNMKMGFGAYHQTRTTLIMIPLEQIYLNLGFVVLRLKTYTYLMNTGCLAALSALKERALALIL